MVYDITATICKMKEKVFKHFIAKIDSKINIVQGKTSFHSII